MQAGVLYTGSDGSVENKVGAHAFCFTNSSFRSCIIGGAAPTPGNKDKLTSLQSESAGALCIILILFAIQEVSHEILPAVTVWI